MHALLPKPAFSSFGAENLNSYYRHANIRRKREREKSQLHKLNAGFSSRSLDEGTRSGRFWVQSFRFRLCSFHSRQLSIQQSILHQTVSGLVAWHFDESTFIGLGLTGSKITTQHTLRIIPSIVFTVLFLAYPVKVFRRKLKSAILPVQFDNPRQIIILRNGFSQQCPPPSFAGQISALARMDWIAEKPLGVFDSDYLGYHCSFLVFSCPRRT